MSSRESSLVPTNLNEWPACESLLPDQRLIFSVLWANRYVGCAGAGQIPLRAFSATLGLSPDALKGGLQDLARRDLILWEEATAEIFILAWFRFHKFKTPLAQKILVAAIKKIESARIKDVVIEKSKSCLPTAAATSTSSSTAAAAADFEGSKTETDPALCERKNKGIGFAEARTYFSRVEFGKMELEKGNERDFQTATQLVKTWGLEKINDAVAGLLAQGKRGFPTNVAKSLGMPTAEEKENPYRELEKFDQKLFSGDGLFFFANVKQDMCSVEIWATQARIDNRDLKRTYVGITHCSPIFRRIENGELTEIGRAK